MKTPKMNIMSKKDKKQNAELIEKLNEIQSQLNDIKSRRWTYKDYPDLRSMSVFK